jgi:hypothetical protein
MKPSPLRYETKFVSALGLCNLIRNRETKKYVIYQIYTSGIEKVKLK